jgi:membrane protein implicated in regulation of membrane protease activity
MEHFFLNLTYLNWLGLAALLFIIEVSTGTGFLLWTGLAALLVGGLSYLFPALSVYLQFLIFALGSILAVLLWRSYLHYNPQQTDRPKLNRRAEQYIGRLFTLTEPTVNGLGTVRVDDSMWRIQCTKDLPAGMQIRIVGADGTILLAEPLE